VHVKPDVLREEFLVFIEKLFESNSVRAGRSESRTTSQGVRADCEVARGRSRQENRWIMSPIVPDPIVAEGLEPRLRVR
jgi:hypothetical protein